MDRFGTDKRDLRIPFGRILPCSRGAPLPPSGRSSPHRVCQGFPFPEGLPFEKGLSDVEERAKNSEPSSLPLLFRRGAQGALAKFWTPKRRTPELRRKSATATRSLFWQEGPAHRIGVGTLRLDLAKNTDWCRRTQLGVPLGDRLPPFRKGSRGGPVDCRASPLHGPEV